MTQHNYNTTGLANYLLPTAAGRRFWAIPAEASSDETHQVISAMRAGIVTTEQINALRIRLNQALTIDRFGISGHINQGLDALANYQNRCTRKGTWNPQQCTFHEMDTIDTAMDLLDLYNQITDSTASQGSIT